ncbi:hypothetical protein NM688_g7568 [Phlebia brevispora]|uniref:Uncharacterized protein n=1 Tax=Phlebia brevispora TaxID=194682 RepID=A0ACC1S3P4_9APHY|nr:hypothetical protein NM688_g7568 [Phlebia brevispora]
MQSEDRFPYIIKDASVQTGSYALETLAGTFGTRLFCINVLAKNDRLYFWYYDACGFVYTESISLLDDFEKTAAVMVAIACSTPQQLGALPDVIQPSIHASYPENWPPENLNGYTLTIPQSVTETESSSPATPDVQATRDIQVTLQESVFSQYVLLGRRTFVYTVKTEPPISSSEHIIKISYQVNTRRKEPELLKLARKAKVGHLPAIHATADLWKMSDGVRAIFLEKGGVEYEDRTLRAIIYDRYMPLESLIPTSPQSIPIMAYQLLDCIHDLRFKANILHRDIAVNNVMYEYREGRLYFILIDFDMATEVSNDPNAKYTPSSKFRTGTLVFMAIELIENAWELSRNKNCEATAHRFCHDVESILWLTIWCMFIFLDMTDKVLKERNHAKVRRWETCDLETAADKKRSFLDKSLPKETMPEGALQAGLHKWFQAWWDIWWACKFAKKRYERAEDLHKTGLGPLPSFDHETVDGLLSRDHLRKVLTAIIPDPYASFRLEEVADGRDVDGAEENSRPGILVNDTAMATSSMGRSEQSAPPITVQSDPKPDMSTKQAKKKRRSAAAKDGKAVQKKETKRTAKKAAVLLAVADSDYDVVALQELWVFEDYEHVRATLARKLPQPKFFYSGALGAELVVLSRYPILAATAAASVLLAHPILGQVQVFNTHLFAMEGDEGPDHFKAHRLVNAWELAKLARQSAEMGRYVIATDAWVETHKHVQPTSSGIPSLIDAIHMYGLTTDSPLNSYSAGKPLESYARKYQGKRLDYVFCRQPSSPPASNKTPHLRCIDTKRPRFEISLPGADVTNPDETYIPAPAEPLSPSYVLTSVPNPNPVPRHALSPEIITSTLQSLIARYRYATAQARVHLTIFTVCLLLLLAIIVGSAWLPRAWINPIFMILTIFLAWLATTMLYIGFVYGRWEVNALTNIIEELEIYRNSLDERAYTSGYNGWRSR